MSNDIYCVYLVTYHGNDLPAKIEGSESPFLYVGSTSIKKIDEGYRGSVRSKRYKDLWREALKRDKTLFTVEIISTWNSRKDATLSELQYQIEHNVVKNPIFVNCALAQEKGFFGISTSGDKNGMFGKGYLNKGKISKRKGIPNNWKEGSIKKAAEKRSKTLAGRNKRNNESVRKQAESHNKLSQELRKELVEKRNNNMMYKDIHQWLISLNINIAKSSLPNIYKRENGLDTSNF